MIRRPNVLADPAGRPSSTRSRCVPQLVLCALVALVVAGCSGPKAWREVDSDRGFGDVWNSFEQIADQAGYRADVSATDRGRREFVSRWRVADGGLRGAERTRLHARFTRPDDEPELWRLEFYIERETAGDMKSRLDPEEGDWESAGQDGLREEVMLGQLRLEFGQDLGIRPSYQRERPSFQDDR